MRHSVDAASTCQPIDIYSGCCKVLFQPLARHRKNPRCNSETSFGLGHRVVFSMTSWSGRAPRSFDLFRQVAALHGLKHDHHPCFGETIPGKKSAMPWQQGIVIKDSRSIVVVGYLLGV